MGVAEVCKGLYEQYFRLWYGTIEHESHLVHLVLWQVAQEVDGWFEVTVQHALLEVADQLCNALLEAHVEAVLGPVALTVT